MDVRPRYQRNTTDTCTILYFHDHIDVWRVRQLKEYGFLDPHRGNDDFVTQLLSLSGGVFLKGLTESLGGCSLDSFTDSFAGSFAHSYLALVIEYFHKSGATLAQLLGVAVDIDFAGIDEQIF